MLPTIGLTLPLTAALTVLTACASLAAPPTDEAALQAEAEQPAEQWLERIEERSHAIDTLTARVRYERVQMLLGDEQTRFGRLIYDAGPPARFHVHFDRLQMHDELQMQDRRYIFDGRWLAERHDDQKLFVLRELVPEGEADRDLLRLGEGPFALPLDLQKDTVLERFDVAVVAEEEPTFENAVLLRLTPRPGGPGNPGGEIDETQIDMWYDRDTLLPMQVRTVNEVDQTETTIRLGEVETGVAVDADVFDVTPPNEPGWQVERHVLGSG